MGLMKTKGCAVLFIQNCKSCGYTIADPEGRLEDKFHHICICPRCGSTRVFTRYATKFQEIRAALGLMPVYRPEKK